MQRYAGSDDEKRYLADRLLSGRHFSREDGGADVRALADSSDVDHQDCCRLQPEGLPSTHHRNRSEHGPYYQQITYHLILFITFQMKVELKNYLWFHQYSWVSTENFEDTFVVVVLSYLLGTKWQTRHDTMTFRKASLLILFSHLKTEIGIYSQLVFGDLCLNDSILIPKKVIHMNKKQKLISNQYLR